MHATCPTDVGHRHFVTPVLVEEEWLVDEAGNWIETVGQTRPVRGPGTETPWRCAECDAVAIVSA